MAFMDVFLLFAKIAGVCFVGVIANDFVRYRKSKETKGKQVSVLNVLLKGASFAYRSTHNIPYIAKSFKHKAKNTPRSMGMWAQGNYYMDRNMNRIYRPDEEKSEMDAPKTKYNTILSKALSQSPRVEENKRKTKLNMVGNKSTKVKPSSFVEGVGTVGTNEQNTPTKTGDPIKGSQVDFVRKSSGITVKDK